MMAALLSALGAPSGARAQGAETSTAPRLQLAVEGAASVGGAGGFAVARDMVSFGLRATLPRSGLQPWLDGARFTRPDFECIPGIECAQEGWLVRGGVEAPLSQDPSEPGVHAGLRAGAGASFAEKTALSYLMGIELFWRVAPRLAPYAEFRWERIAGLNLTLAGIGLRVDL